MTTLPKIRNKVSISAGDNNRSLKNILAPMGPGVEVIGVEAIKAPMYNTKATIRIDNSKAHFAAAEFLPTARFVTRQVLYSRIDINKIIPEGIVFENNELPTIINTLNTKHQCDFTEDDLEIVEAKLTAKETSIGYIGSFALAGVEVIEPPPENEINCDGALPVATPVYTEGVFELTIDGVLVGTGTIEELQPIALEHGIQIYYAPTQVVY